MKICMLVTNEVSSDPRVLKEACTLNNEGYDVTVIGRKLNKATESFEYNSGIRIIRVFQKSYRRSKGILQIMKTLFKVLMINLKMFFQAWKLKAQVYHAHDLDTLLVAVTAGKLLGSKIIYDSHELYSEQRDDFPFFIKRGMQLFEKLLITKVALVITVNYSISNELTKRYNINPPEVLYNFTRYIEVEPLLRTSQRKVLRFSEDQVIVLYHGGYQVGRGLEELIESAKFVDSNVVIALRGYGPIEEDLRQLVKQLGVGGKVKFIPPVAMENLVKEAIFADIGIVSYRPTCLNNHYSLPNKLFEYMMAGLAVVSRELPEIRKLNDKIDFGTLFPDDSPDEIARAINELARDKPLLDLCKANALQWSKSTGNWEKEGEKLKAIYSRCDSGKNAVPKN